MFGGVNDDNATGQPAEQHQVVPTDGALDDGSQHAAVTDDAAVTAYPPTDDTSVDADPAAAEPTATAQPADTAAADPAPAAGNDDLLSIKQQALQDLSPLVSHLDQTPDEKFRTTMMLIQASDNPDLIKEAYDAAQQIPDEKVRAQALLDIVNEINYFTQHQEQQ